MSCTEVRRFTGLANYCRRFVEGYAEIAAPLMDCAAHGADCAPHRRAVPTTDASGIAVAAILTQPDDEGRQHPVA